MGRLMLNVLLSFAQFEREVISERVRDKFAASKKKGLWLGGMPPLGYDVKDRKLVVNEAEASIVFDIFRRYLELKSVHALRDELGAAGIRSMPQHKSGPLALMFRVRSLVKLSMPQTCLSELCRHGRVGD
jgi:Resolvase, N terminal domain